MSRKVLIPVLIAVVAAAATIGVLTAHAQGSSTLPAVTPAQLLADVATKAHDTTSISGDVTWTNNLLGDMSALNLGGATTPTGIASLLQGGSGRIWLQDGDVRLESQGQGGDLVVVASGDSLWMYSSATNTATEYALPAGAGDATSPSPEAAASIVDPTAQIEQALQKLAPTATMVVSGQEEVAGQPAYILSLTPSASNTTLGSVKVAIDGNTFVPLRIEVFAEGSSSATLSAGFTSVSYSKIDDTLFAFTPPEGAKVEHKTVDLPEGLGAGESAGEASGTESGDAEAESSGAGTDSGGGEAESGGGGLSAPSVGFEGKHGMKPLTLAQAEARAGFDLALPTQTELPFSGAAVVPAEPGSEGQEPVVLLHYGKAFGSILLVESRVTADQMAGLEEELTQLAKMGMVQ
ncbi:MAG TPA: hypothetical protein VJ787_00620, partial [Thermoleophilia bacterium]|nr:hypothetical protein [Thermoleophilia bacterium]